MLRKLPGLIALGVLLVAAQAEAQDPGGDPPAEEAPTEESEAADATGSSTDELSPSEESPAPPQGESSVAEATPEGEAPTEAATVEATAAKAPEEGEPGDEDKDSNVSRKLGKWEVGLSGYFRAPMALGISSRPGPDDLTGDPQTQVSYGPNRTVDSNYYSFGYTRLQERDWVEMFVHAKRKHVEATIGWMGYWFAAAGFRNPDAAWVPGVAYLTLDTDFKLGGMKPNVALSGGSWWPRFGYHEKYDTYTLGMYRQLGEQLKLTLPFTKDFTTTLVQGFGTGRDGSFNLGAPPPYQDTVGINLLVYEHLQVNYKSWLEVGLHHNMQWTRDPNLFETSTTGKSYSNAREAKLMTLGAEVKLNVPRVGKLWLSPSMVLVKNGWAMTQAGVEVVHSLGPESVATNYLGWTGSTANSTGTGKLMNLGFNYENSLSNVMGKETGGNNEVRLGLFGLLVDSQLDLPSTTLITYDHIQQFKWGADVEYNPWKWVGIMGRWDAVNYDTLEGGYLFAAITGRVSFYGDYLSGERIYLQYSRYIYGDYMTIAGTWPWGAPLVAGSDVVQAGPYTGSKPDMDVIKFQADIKF